MAGPPGVEGELRATRAERSAAQEALRQAVADEALTLDEFEERIGSVLSARTRGELEVLTADLPDTLRPDPAAIRPRRARRWLVAVMGSEEQRGQWRPAKSTIAVAVMGGVEIDLRQADFEDGLQIVAVALMGGVEIIVPPGVDIDLGGFALMGGRTNKVPPDAAASRVVRVEGYAVMGGVDIVDKPLPPGVVAGDGRASSSRALAGRAESVPATRREYRDARRGGRGRGLKRWLVGLTLAAGLVWGAGAVVSDADVVSVFGEQRYDLTTSDTEVGVGVLFGSATVVVPDGMGVRNNAVAVFGSSRCEACGQAPPSDSTDTGSVRVRGLVLFGSVEIVNPSPR